MALQCCFKATQNTHKFIYIGLIFYPFRWDNKCIVSIIIWHFCSTLTMTTLSGYKISFLSFVLNSKRMQGWWEGVYCTELNFSWWLWVNIGVKCHSSAHPLVLSMSSATIKTGWPPSTWWLEEESEEHHSQQDSVFVPNVLEIHSKHSTSWWHSKRDHWCFHSSSI